MKDHYVMRYWWRSTVVLKWLLCYNVAHHWLSLSRVISAITQVDVSLSCRCYLVSLLTCYLMLLSSRCWRVISCRCWCVISCRCWRVISCRCWRVISCWCVISCRCWCVISCRCWRVISCRCWRVISCWCVISCRCWCVISCCRRHDATATGAWGWPSWLPLCRVSWPDGGWHTEPLVYWGRPVQQQPVWNERRVSEGGRWRGTW